MRRMNTFCTYLLSFAILGSLEKIHLFCVADPSDGFSSVPLTESNFKVQTPYDIPLKQRHSYGAHISWHCADDKPHDPDSHTQPHAKIRIKGFYSSGVWQFDGVVPNGISGALVAQIHGAGHGADTLILRIYDGDLRYYKDPVNTDVYDRRFRFSVVHDVDKGMLTVYIDGFQRFQAKDKGPGDLCFRCGVYAAPTTIRYYLEASKSTKRDRIIKIFDEYVSLFIKQSRLFIEQLRLI